MLTSTSYEHIDRLALSALHLSTQMRMPRPHSLPKTAWETYSLHMSLRVNNKIEKTKKHKQKQKQTATTLQPPTTTNSFSSICKNTNNNNHEQQKAHQQQQYHSNSETLFTSKIHLHHSGIHQPDLVKDLLYQNTSAHCDCAFSHHHAHPHLMRLRSIFRWKSWKTRSSHIRNCHSLEESRTHFNVLATPSPPVSPTAAMPQPAKRFITPIIVVENYDQHNLHPLRTSHVLHPCARKASMGQIFEPMEHAPPPPPPTTATSTRPTKDHNNRSRNQFHITKYLQRSFRVCKIFQRTNSEQSNAGFNAAAARVEEQQLRFVEVADSGAAEDSSCCGATSTSKTTRMTKKQPSLASSTRRSESRNCITQ